MTTENEKGQLRRARNLLLGVIEAYEREYCCLEQDADARNALALFCAAVGIDAADETLSSGAYGPERPPIPPLTTEQRAAAKASRKRMDRIIKLGKKRPR